MKNKFLKYLSIVFLTAIIFLGGLYFVTRLVTPKAEIEKFYDEPKNTIDIIVVGGSHSMCSVSPMQIWEETGYTTFNLSSWSQPIWVSYHYIKEALKYQKPQVVVLDTFGALYDTSYLTGVDVDLVSDDFSQLIKPSLNLVELNVARRRVQVTKKTWSEYINIAKYHSRLTELLPQDFDALFKNEATSAKGYGPFYTSEDFLGYEYPVTSERSALYAPAQEYLLKTIALCKENDIQLILYSAPYIGDEQDVRLMNTIRDISEENDTIFIDFISENIANLDFKEDFADHAHINVFGAKKVSEVIISEIKNLNLKCEHSEEVIQNWNADCAFENNNILKMETKIRKDFPTYVQRLTQQGTTSLIIAKQGATLDETDIQKMTALLNSADISVTEQQMLDYSLFVLDNGELLTGNGAKDWCDEKNILVSTEGEAQILFDGEDYSFHRDGLNLALYDSAENEIYHYISYAKEHDYTPFTR